MPPAPVSNGCSQLRRLAPKWAAPILATLTPGAPKSRSHNHCAGILVARKVSVILAVDVPSAFAAKAATKTIPIVFVSGADPVKIGLVESFSRPQWQPHWYGRLF